MSSRFSRTIYVGNLPADIREGEIDDLFYKVGVLIIIFSSSKLEFCCLLGDGRCIFLIGII